MKTKNIIIPRLFLLTKHNIVNLFTILVIVALLSSFWGTRHLFSLDNNDYSETRVRDEPRYTLKQWNDLMIQAHKQQLEKSAQEIQLNLQEGLVKKPVVQEQHSQPPVRKEHALDADERFDQVKTPSPYAYAFVLGGIHEDRPAYKGYVYDILVSASLLKRLGSTSDIWVWAQLSTDSTLTDLPAEDKRMFQALGIHVELLDKPEHESFAVFRPLQMTNYKRVMFLDAAAIPLVNLDYMFHLSDPDNPKQPTLLRSNLIMASRFEPVNAGMFILEPKEGDWELLQGIVERQQESAKNLPYPHFNRAVDWGHWEGIKRNGTKWDYHASHSDQGLLYYWAKFFKQDVSIVIGDKVQNWVPDNTTGLPKLLTQMFDDPLKNYSAPTPLAYQHGCNHEKYDNEMSHLCRVPYRDFAHFMGRNKPWQNGYSPYFLQGTNHNAYAGARRIWFQELIDLNTKYSMGIDFKEWEDSKDALMVQAHTQQLETSAQEIQLNLQEGLVKKPVVHQVKTPSPYAYAFVLGGIHEDRPAYKGFVYDILVSASLLKRLGSTSDIWVWAQLSTDSTLTDLPAEDKRLFSALGIHVELLDTPEHDSFAHIVYEKFRPLQMTNYKRVMFLDADAIPLVNLDYMFHLSDPDNHKQPTLLRSNLIMASRSEPVNAGMFILEPKEGDWELLQGIVERQQESAKNLPYPHFNRGVGWGRDFRKENDYWEGIQRNGTIWDYHAAHSDQGLLYYWAKFFKQDVSIVIGTKIQNWVPDTTTGLPKLLTQMFDEPLKNHSAPTPLAYQHGCNHEKYDNDMSYLCRVPYRDFAHFMGHNKPWQHGYSPYFLKGSNHNAYAGARRIWFKELIDLNTNYSMGIDFKEWEESKHLKDMEESPLGYMAMYLDHQKKMLQLRR